MKTSPLLVFEFRTIGCSNIQAIDCIVFNNIAFIPKNRKFKCNERERELISDKGRDCLNTGDVFRLELKLPKLRSWQNAIKAHLISCMFMEPNKGIKVNMVYTPVRRKEPASWPNLIVNKIEKGYQGELHIKCTSKHT